VLSLENKSFSWSNDKNRENIRKHGLSLQEAVPVFLDPYLIIRHDEAHSSMEETRWKGIGMLGNELLLAVIFTEDENEVRFISARKAIKKEKEDYRENISRIFGT